MNNIITSKGLYFIHSFDDNYEYRNSWDHEENREIEKAILFRDIIDNPDSISAYSISLTRLMSLEQEIREGDFVDYNGENFIKADYHPVVIMYRELSNQLIRQIGYANYRNRSEPVDNRLSNVFSFHINVGHGNCSIILFKENNTWKIWMVDCSYYDYTNYSRYRNHYGNIIRCLNDIEKEYGVNVVSKLLITHLHYDHISAIDKLISDGYINKDTEVWMNTKYPWIQPSYLRILSNLNAINVRFIDPIVSNSTEQIKVLYPQIIFDKTNQPPLNKINNSSVVYQIVLNGKRMLFPGDLETDGWNELSCCYPYLKHTDYYCISHHGSINGHIRKSCKPQGRKILNLSDCSCSRIQILMGRNNAYSGIYSPMVLRDFKGIKKTEDAKHYIMINWDSDEVKYN